MRVTVSVGGRDRHPYNILDAWKLPGNPEHRMNLQR
jgi:hypothetical protein